MRRSQQPEQEQDPRLHRLLSLARRHQHGHAPHRGERTFERVQAALEARRARAPSRRVIRGALLWGAPALALAALAVFSWRSMQAPLRYEVKGAVAMASGEIVGGEQSRLLFTDGSALTLSRGARARVASLDANGGDIELSDGEAHVAIQKRSRTQWFVHAGPYRVRVTGTAFDVQWSAGERSFELTMQEGEVLLSGPLLDGAVRLRAGQRLRALLDAQRVEIEDARVARRQDQAQDQVDAADPLEASDLVEVEIEPPPRAERKARRAREPLGEGVESGGKGPWAQRLSRGDFRGVLRDAERFGIDRALASAPLYELSALADAARFVRDDALARRALLSVRKRFPHSELASDAAFLLGRLHEARDGEQAASWYTLYLRERPSGPYAAQALGRHMLHVYRSDGATSARPLAARYLERHPDGAYADTARRIVAGTTRQALEQ